MKTYLRVSGRNSRTCHIARNHASINAFCPISDELRLFSKNTCLKNGKRHRNEIARVIDIKRMCSVAPQYCTTLGTSRNTVRNEIHPEKKKRTLQPASTAYDGIGARTTQHVKFLTKNTRHTTLVFMLCYCCHWVTFKSSQNCANVLDNELT